MIKHKLDFEECICRECCSTKNVLFCRDTETFICKQCLEATCKDIEEENETAIVDEYGAKFKETNSYGLVYEEACKTDLEEYLK